MAAAALVLSATYYEVGDFVEVVTFLVDSHGWIQTESDLNAVINELEEEMFQEGHE